MGVRGGIIGDAIVAGIKWGVIGYLVPRIPFHSIQVTLADEMVVMPES